MGERMSADEDLVKTECCPVRRCEDRHQSAPALPTHESEPIYQRVAILVGQDVVFDVVNVKTHGIGQGNGSRGAAIGRWQNRQIDVRADGRVTAAINIPEIRTARELANVDDARALSV